ncbi:MAG: DUF1819 family protein, partial [Acidobacteria bacterium]|nr:DUF1819 family protein [Acidobacteriota bacterium]
VIAQNLLQARTMSTLERVYREIVARLGTLSLAELQFLVTNSRQDQAYLLWIAACRRYRFIADFAVEVLRERFITLQKSLTHDDFDSFFNRKAEWHLELDRISLATRSKLRQVLFKILREADLLTPDNEINPAIPGPVLLELIERGHREDILCLPMFESSPKGRGR